MSVKHLSTTIISTGRVRNSRSGNPSVSVETSDGPFRTALDASVAYSIENAEYKGPVTLTLDDGLIVGVATADGAHWAGRQS